MASKKKRELICTTHDKMREVSKYLTHLDFSGYTLQEILDEQANLNKLGDELEELIDYASESGQNMEDRLSEYCNAIEELGFVRKRS
jgi:DNA repair ATPase RecN